MLVPAEAWEPEEALAVRDECEEDEISEPEEVRKLREVRAPTAQQRREHIARDHAEYRDWCEVCIAARGIGGQHRRTLKTQAQKEQEGARRSLQEQGDKAPPGYSLTL